MSYSQLMRRWPIPRQPILNFQTPATRVTSRSQAAQNVPSPTIPNSRFIHTSPTSFARKKQQIKKDKRITLIRYFLTHPLTPRPLRFSRNRSLRHWTIHRAYQLFRSKQRQARELELERQFQSMRDACEALRLIGENGLAISEPGNAIPPPGARDIHFVMLDSTTKSTDKGPRPTDGVDVKAAADLQRDVGRLYRTAMLKTGIWDGVPIEYARAQTETPSKKGWDHSWTR